MWLETIIEHCQDNIHAGIGEWRTWDFRTAHHLPRSIDAHIIPWSSRPYDLEENRALCARMIDAGKGRDLGFASFYIDELARTAGRRP